MEIDLQTQLDQDFDWFCLDETGAVGHFTTGGFKRLPVTAARSAEDLKLVTEYFERQRVGGGGYRVDASLSSEIPDPKNRGDRYLRSFVQMADKGLFSFDIMSHIEPDTCYFRVACPNRPIRVAELPDSVREILERTILKRRLSDTSRIPYEETLSM